MTIRLDITLQSEDRPQISISVVIDPKEENPIPKLVEAYNRAYATWLQYEGKPS